MDGRAAGRNVGVGNDHTLFTKIDGIVAFERFQKNRRRVAVYPEVEGGS